jgi:hypothetical protein
MGADGDDIGSLRRNGRDRDAKLRGNREEPPVKTNTRYITALLAAAAIGAAISLAPVALAAPATATATVVSSDPTPVSSDPTPAPVTGGDPEVPYGTQDYPDVDNLDGNSLAY